MAPIGDGDVQRVDVQVGVEPGDDRDGLLVPLLGEVLARQPLEQQHRPTRVGPQQPCGATSVPRPQRQVLPVGLAVRPAELEHGPAVGPAHGQHERAVAGHRAVVDCQLPLGEDLGDEAGEGGDPVTAGGTPFGSEARDSRREVRRHEGRGVLDPHPVAVVSP